MSVIIGRRRGRPRKLRGYVPGATPTLGSGLREALKIYVFEAGAVVKIGISHDPVGRIKEIQIGNSDVVRCFWAAICGNREQARSLEMACHRCLKASGHRVRGEWFYITPELAVDVIKRVADETDAFLLPCPNYGTNREIPDVEFANGG